eukprot:CAMPEP_0183740210 /NCGR_PEP_ID=MMETSP0737-20130205/59007_1 /TAXON_ID=385413 /ORGANISM="Thalassiosira miniscula, Strain CCMP1093" /LENGTH=162 /DNA_ID=CAMNT_0025975211 /DNA_START=1146 /DNA_END=1630 /DNA_ORIENTATION=+
MISAQLIEGVKEWESIARALLSEPNHGIPTIWEVNKSGRRKQDKENFEAQLEAESVRTANLRRAVITVQMIETEAKGAELSNDQVLRLGEERLALWVKLTEMSIKKYWEKLNVVEGQSPGKVVMWQAWKSFSRMHEIVHRRDGASPVCTKSEALEIIGSYLA